MNTNSKIFSINRTNFKIYHLLLITILIFSVFLTFQIRAIPSNYGLELNEFDSFYNYRATQYLLENGIQEYFNWRDDLSWYPEGRNVSATSQVSLHITTAIFYWVFGAGTNLYTFTILIPLIFASFSTIVIFGLVRTLKNTQAGIIASLMFSISIPLLLRGSIGWFKSEPFGIFIILLSSYFLLSGLSSKNFKILVTKLILSGILFSIGLSGWGGTLILTAIFSTFIISLPFSKKINFIWSLPLFTFSVFMTAFLFERPGPNFIFGIGGILLIISNIFFIFAEIIKKKSNEKHHFRNNLFLLAGFLIISLVFILINAGTNEYLFPTFRYFNAINPFVTTSDTLVASISEHGIASINDSFLFHSSFMIFAGIGIWFLFKSIQNNSSRNYLSIFALVFGIFGIYLGSTFMRLEIFSSLALIIFSSIGISELIILFNKKKSIIKLSLYLFCIFIFIVPVFLSPSSVITYASVPPTILNGGSQYLISTNDWNDALKWIKNNTDENSVIASWWDYGYWIQTKSERTTLIDNATLSSEKIEKIAKILFSEPQNAWKSLKELEVDYLVIFVVGERLPANLNDQGMYVLGGGGDESKKSWIVRIANLPENDYFLPGTDVSTNLFWEETLLGKLIPFSVLGFVDPMTNNDYYSYQPGTIPIYVKDIKFDESDPFTLVYSSPSFNADKGEAVIGVFIYKLNPDYQYLD